MIRPDSLKRTEDLFKSQKLAVLSTLQESKPYCNLVAFVATGDCKALIFATNRNTSKYRNLLNNPRVSLLIDDRTNLNTDFVNAVAVTAMGTAKEISPNERLLYANLLITKHPNIANFFKDAENALFKVQISDYIIASFQSIEKLHFENAED